MWRASSCIFRYLAEARAAANAAGDPETALNWQCFSLPARGTFAAPSLIVEEAGGRFTDLRGRSDLTSGTALFSNGLLHDDVLRLVEPVVAKFGKRPTAS